MYVSVYIYICGIDFALILGQGKSKTREIEQVVASNLFLMNDRLVYYSPRVTRYVIGSDK